MAKFLRHTSCPQCGSRDNLGEYDDGSAYCFGCHFSKPACRSRYVTERESSIHPVETNVPRLLGNTSYDPRCVQGWSACGCSVEELLLFGARWDSDREQLNYPLRNLRGETVAIQSRNYNQSRSKTQKYFNQGKLEEAFPIVKSKQPAFGRRLVITEDILSSIKIGRQCDAMAALGTSLPAHKMSALAPLYESVRVWLDSDKWRESMHIADSFKWLGLSAKSVYSDLDPKYYSNEEITEFIK